MSEDWYVLRGATIRDTDFLYELRNDPSVREQSFQTDKIVYENHKKWLKEKLEKNDVLIFIMEHCGEKIGQVRIDMDKSGKWGNISYAVRKDYRKKGAGTWMLKKVEEMLYRSGLQGLVGEVKRNNVASQKVFQRLGYNEKVTDYGYEYSKILEKRF